MVGSFGLLLIILAVLVVSVIAAYNGLVKLRVQAENAWADVDVQLKRRYDLIPNLVETVKGYAAHEKGTLEAVINARNRAMSAQGPAAKAEAEGMLAGALRQLFALAEAYPQLRAVESFTSLQGSLNEIEDTASFIGDANYFLVKNFINNTSFFEWDQATYNSYFHRIKDATELTIPKLNEMAFEQVEVASVPFLKFVANKGMNDDAANYSFVLRGYVRHWLANVWSEFDRIKLTDLVGSSKPVARVTGEK